MEVFLRIYPGITSDFLRPKYFSIKNFTYAIKTLDKKLGNKKIVGRSIFTAMKQFFVKYFFIKN
jgi:hypothetical protein